MIFESVLRSVVSHVEVDDFARRVAVIRQNVVVQTESSLNLWRQRRSMPMPVANVRWKRYKTTAFGGRLGADAGECAREKNCKNQKKAGIERPVILGMDRCRGR